MEPGNVVFAALAESSLVEDRTGWPIRKIVCTVTGLVANGYLPGPRPRHADQRSIAGRIRLPQPGSRLGPGSATPDHDRARRLPGKEPR